MGILALFYNGKGELVEAQQINFNDGQNPTTRRNLTQSELAALPETARKTEIIPINAAKPKPGNKNASSKPEKNKQKYSQNQKAERRRQ